MRVTRYYIYIGIVFALVEHNNDNVQSGIPCCRRRNRAPREPLRLACNDYNRIELT